MISNSMRWYWKVSFVICVFWVGYVFSEGFSFGGFIFDSEDFATMTLPITIWITVRWISLNSENKK